MILYKANRQEIQITRKSKEDLTNEKNSRRSEALDGRYQLCLFLGIHRSKPKKLKMMISMHRSSSGQEEGSQILAAGESNTQRQQHKAHQILASMAFGQTTTMEFIRLTIVRLNLTMPPRWCLILTSSSSSSLSCGSLSCDFYP